MVIAVAPQRENDFTVSLLRDVLEEGLVAVPLLFLRCYTRVGLNEAEAMLLVQMLALRQRGELYPTAGSLAPYVSGGEETARRMLESLAARKFVQPVAASLLPAGRQGPGYVLEGLFEALAEVWAAERVERETAVAQAEAAAAGDPRLAEVYRLFEQEFGRPLSRMEGAQISEWVLEDGFAPELVAEALKRAVLRGVFNFRYVDSILKDWAKHRVRNVREAVEHEERFQRQRPRGGTRGKSGERKGGNGKYRDLYLT